MGFMLLGLMSGVVNGQVDANVAGNAYSAAMFYVITVLLHCLLSELSFCLLVKVLKAKRSLTLPV